MWSNMIVQLESVMDFLSGLSRQILLCQQLKELATKNINNKVDNFNKKTIILKFHWIYCSYKRKNEAIS